MATNFYTPEQNAGWGLIYRLNDLWAKVDREALGGNFDKWELTLDRILSNLLYRESVRVVVDGSGKIKDIKLSKSDMRVWDEIKKKIRFSKVNQKKCMRNGDLAGLSKYKLEHYNNVMLYDIWLRKFMYTLDLYLKETESNPSQSLFGGAFKKRQK